MTNKYSVLYLTTIDNNSLGQMTLKIFRSIVKGSGFRIWPRGRDPRGVVADRNGAYAAQSDFPLYLNPPKIALYLRASSRVGHTVGVRELKAKISKHLAISA